MRYVPAELLALVDVGLGDHARALADLGEVCRNRSNGMVYLAVEPAMTPLLPEPRFQQLVRTGGRRAGGPARGDAACP